MSCNDMPSSSDSDQLLSDEPSIVSPSASSEALSDSWSVVGDSPPPEGTASTPPMSPPTSPPSVAATPGTLTAGGDAVVEDPRTPAAPKAPGDDTSTTGASVETIKESFDLSGVRRSQSGSGGATERTEWVDKWRPIVRAKVAAYKDQTKAFYAANPTAVAAFTVVGCLLILGQLVSPQVEAYKMRHAISSKSVAVGEIPPTEEYIEIYRSTCQQTKEQLDSDLEACIANGHRFNSMGYFTHCFSAYYDGLKKDSEFCDFDERQLVMGQALAHFTEGRRWAADQVYKEYEHRRAAVSADSTRLWNAFQQQWAGCKVALLKNDRVQRAAAHARGLTAEIYEKAQPRVTELLGKIQPHVDGFKQESAKAASRLSSACRDLRANAESTIGNFKEIDWRAIDWRAIDWHAKAVGVKDTVKKTAQSKREQLKSWWDVKVANVKAASSRNDDTAVFELDDSDDTDTLVSVETTIAA